MNIRSHSILLASATLVVSALLVARAPAREPSPENAIHSVRASLTGAVMCVAEPRDPPPCATPKAASR